MKDFKKSPIGIFDSGLGGLSVFKEIHKLLPNESIIYFADNLNCPYGNKSVEEINLLSKRIVDFLINEKNCKFVVIACNTVTVSVISDLRKNFNVPFVGIEPAIKIAVNLTKNKSIGILATERTLKSDSFLKLEKNIPDDIYFYKKAGICLVEIVENCEIDLLKTKKLLKNYLKVFLDNDVDQLVLGCTHYPFLSEVINSIVGNKINLIDPAEAVARRVKNQLEVNSLLFSDNVPRFEFYSSGDKFVFEKALKLFDFEWDELEDYF